MKNIFLSVTALLFVSCAKSTLPADIYAEYHKRLISGISYEEELSYFSERKKAEINNELRKLVENSERSEFEWKAVFANRSTLYANCLKITLVKQEVEDTEATLLYTQKDVCNDDHVESLVKKISVNMVFEDGWKIENIVRENILSR